ncbi:MAG: siderophore-interacting protein, partial [Pseudomonadota bacterium]
HPHNPGVTFLSATPKSGQPFHLESEICQMSQPDTHPDYPFASHADLPGVAFTDMRQVILEQAKSGNLPILEDRDQRLTVETAHGLIGLRPGIESEIAGMVAGQDARWLFVMKKAVIGQMRHMMPAVADAVRWSDSGEVTALPPNFQFMRTIQVEQLGPVFLRATLQGEDVTTYGTDSIHFRLVQPVLEGHTDWPTVAQNGSIKWTDGPGAPHKPVYTVRSVDYDAGQIITDIYLHDGGKTTEWAAEIKEGSKARNVIGLIGPMGGGLIKAKRILMAADETGFPAAARILENLPGDATGEIFLEAENGAECDYPVEAPKDLRVTWLSRAKGDRLLDAVLGRYTDFSDTPIWFAGEKDQARQLREITKEAGYDSENLRISGFWRDESVAPK